MQLPAWFDDPDQARTGGQLPAADFRRPGDASDVLPLKIQPVFSLRKGFKNSFVRAHESGGGRKNFFLRKNS